ncbi:MAG: WD40 repeat domain-containing protein [Chloroflexi bacterium]|nr:WD40 repeat domain-containing protein [Chloroflexota bacterium]
MIAGQKSTRRSFAKGKTVRTVAIVVLCALLTTVSGVAQINLCEAICSVAWSPTDEHLLAAVDTNGLWLFDVREPDAEPQFFPHPNSIDVSFDPTGNRIAVITCSLPSNVATDCSSTLSLFDLADQSWEPLAAFDFKIDDVEFSPDNRYLAFKQYGSGGSGIQLIDLASGESSAFTQCAFTCTTNAIAFDAHSELIAISNGWYGYGTVGYEHWGISVWNLTTHFLVAYNDQPLLFAPDWRFIAPDVMFTESGTEIVFIGYDTAAFRWDFLTGITTPLRSFTDADPDYLNQLNFSAPPPDFLTGLVFYNRSQGRRLFVWEYESGDVVFTRDMPNNTVIDQIALNSTGEYLVYTSSWEGDTIDVWELHTERNFQLQVGE